MLVVTKDDTAKKRGGFVADRCRAALSDLLSHSHEEDGAHPATFTVTITDDQEDPGWLLVACSTRPPWVHGFGIDAEAGPSGVSIALASGLQDAVIDMLRITVPACPGHQHPLTPVMRDSPRWECPRDARHFHCPIGGYEPAQRAHRADGTPT